MPGPQPPSRQSSISSHDTGVDAALVGAATAFGRNAPVRCTLSHAGNVGNRGASAAAAATAGKGRQLQHSRLPFPPQRSPAGSVRGVQPQERVSLDLSHVPNLTTPQQASVQPVKSASQQAAFLASSRACPHPPPARPAVAPKPRRLSSQQAQVGVSVKSTDSTPIPPTTSLVDLFERKSKPQSQIMGNNLDSAVLKSPHNPHLRSPKLTRSGITSMFQLELDESSPLGTPRTTRATRGLENSLPKQEDGHSSEDSFASASEEMNVDSPGRFALVNSARSQSHSPSSVAGIDGMQNGAGRRPVSASPLRSTMSQPVNIERPSAVSRDPFPASSSLSTKSIQAQFNMAYPRPGRMTPLTTGDQLANALVASSLASSRAPSPTRLEPPPVPTRRRRYPHSHHNVLAFSRTPSPAKTGMLHTLRAQDASSDLESDTELHPYGKHKKKRLVRKHPNKHHEGDRKRWRDAVTERERKRYEGVWAANKGIHWSYTAEEEQLLREAPDSERSLEIESATCDQVSNVVVRDIWNRSRLPEATLETVWDLVDHEAVGRLSREEFVVGMWLIDQRLKGRKLPVKVTDSVWASVRSLQGIKIRK